MADILTSITDLKKIIEENEFTFLEFTAPWCSQCKMMLPTINQIEGEFSPKVRFLIVDTDKSPDISSEYAIQSLPTFIFFVKNEKKEMFQLRSKSHIQGLLNKYISGGKND